jgi:hypothetical protein
MPKLRISQKFLIITFLSFLFLFFVLGEIVEAGPYDNVYGWAWSSNIGWLSFNCYNYYGNNPQDLQNRCGNMNYGVNITIRRGEGTNGGDLGIYSGWAWSPNIGWITFNRAIAGKPPAQPFDGENDTYLAQVDFPCAVNPRQGEGCPTLGEGKVAGWARAISVCPQLPCQTTDNNGGWDGWIKLGDIEPRRSQRAVWKSQEQVNLGSPTGVGYQSNFKKIVRFLKGFFNFSRALASLEENRNSYSPRFAQVGGEPGGGGSGSTGQQGRVEHKGWAWGSDVIGWVSFNCINASEANCNTSNYKVLWDPNVTPRQQPPLANNLQSEANYCGIRAGEGKIDLTWTYVDQNIPPSDQSQYHLQVATNSNFSSTVINCIVNQPVSSGSQGSSSLRVLQQLPDNVCNDGGELGNNRDLAISYGNTYYWRLKVRNQEGVWSEWHTASTPFQTSPHPYPWVDFRWAPQPPRIKERVDFIDQSTCYSGAGNCRRWDWTFPSDWTFGEGSGPNEQNPFGQFETTGDKQVTLKVTDSNNNYCSRTKAVRTTLPLPKYKEIQPR